jgi:uncharacterized protein
MLKRLPQKASPRPLLRGHHLVCLHFYNGEGYDDSFRQYLADILITAAAGKVEICAGADSVCAECRYLERGNCKYHENAEKEISIMDGTALRLLGLSEGACPSWNELRHKVDKILDEWYRLYCGDCDWRQACEKNDDFRRLTGSSK